MRQLVIIAHNIRSAYNVGSIMRSADGFGAEKVYLSGYSPYPPTNDDVRLPHVQQKAAKMIAKTALDAEKNLAWEHAGEVKAVLRRLKEDGYLIAALEQSKKSKNLAQFKPPDKVALLLGSEVAGVDPELLKKMDVILEIPMRGSKESYNVAVAVGIAMYAISTAG